MTTALIPDPPSPGLPPALLQLLARLAWSPTGAVDGIGAPLGAFGDTALYFASSNQWAAGPLVTTAPALGPFWCSEGTASVLQRGALASDGSVTFNGKHFRVRALTENGRNIARAIEVG